MESHAHRLAKDLFIGWLREAAEAAGPDGYAQFAGYSWRVSRGGPHWGVWAEYPVLYDGRSLDTVVWDEDDDRWLDRPPTYDEVVATGARPACVVDIAIQHKGLITCVIEVRHKHAVSPRKLHLLRQHTSVLEVATAWILGQIDRPSEIPPEFWLCR